MVTNLIDQKNLCRVKTASVKLFVKIKADTYELVKNVMIYSSKMLGNLFRH